MVSLCVCVCVLVGAGVVGVESIVRRGSEERSRGARLREGFQGCWVARLTALRSTLQLSSVHT